MSCTLHRLGDNCGASEMEDIEDSGRLLTRILKRSLTDYRCSQFPGDEDQGQRLN